MILYTACFLLFCLVAVIIGRYTIVKKLRVYEANFEFYIEFSNAFTDFVDSKQMGKADFQKYGWLLTKMDRMQNLLGYIGIVRYSNPMRREVFNNYPVILNEIPKLNDIYLDNNTIGSIQQALLRYNGITSEEISAIREQLNSYLKCFSEGIAQIVSGPFYVLSAFNLLSLSTVTWLINNKIYRGLSGLVVGIVWLTGFSSDFVTVLGFDPVKNYLAKQFNRDTIKNGNTRNRAVPVISLKSQIKQPLAAQPKKDSNISRTALGNDTFEVKSRPIRAVTPNNHRN
ncbi:hypothetical protein [Fibrella forsythiae]|uniref:DUF4239 domain-containing protein n=1 Tax=Fibrella forsythiae TaxID=2817061 RepID=A0ABS3JTC8_9BACT|nr:hypothetical protein [Fibrella forsythiae]MBO0953261.1 hypothetical protein [Fibrella forsythiae]